MKNLFCYIACCIAILNTTVAIAQSNGCGSENSIATPGVVKFFEPQGAKDFKAACDKHDKDYQTIGKSKEDADTDFHKTTTNICKKYEGKTVTDNSSRVPKQVDAQKKCQKSADKFYKSVKKHGHEAYNKAQEKAKRETLNKIWYRGGENPY